MTKFLFSRGLSCDLSEFDKGSLSNELRINVLSESGFSARHSVIDKFNEDKVFFNDENYLILTDGVIFNLKDLQNSYAAKDLPDLLMKLFEKHHLDFPSVFRGEFCGLVHDKKLDKTFVYNNHTGSKWIFYYHSGSIFIVSTSLQQIASCLKQNNIPFHLDEISAYNMLSVGYMLLDNTLVKEVKKINPGTVICFSEEKLSHHEYYRLKNDPEVDDVSIACKELDERFRHAVRQEYEKDLQHGYSHLATLSGGLDAKTVVWYANEEGFENQEILNFSETGALDDTIAAKVARDLNLNRNFIPLDNGLCLIDSIKDLISINSGMYPYFGSAHVLYAFNKFKVKDFGLLHTGQIGDAVLGSFITANVHTKPQAGDLKKYSHSLRFFGEIEEYISKNVIGQYENTEQMIFHTRAYNGAYNGYRTIENFMDYASPFMHVDFLDYALKISPALRKNREIYIRWLGKYARQVMKYPWTSKAGLPADAPLILSKGIKAYRLLRKKIFSQQRTDNMYPIEYWFRTNENIRNYYNMEWKDANENLVIKSDLLNNMNMAYLKGGIEEKGAVLSLFESVRQLNLNEA
ncbi:MAG: hypothetical protein JXR53_12115 [Bacteroidales bacterium]|nr:hypothetical protein [Bacteroidales bacterium]